ncbi:protein NDRG2-like [Porphyrio hochstetteri]
MEVPEPRAATPPPPAQGKGALLETPYGTVTVSTWGTPRPGRPALLTFPDVGHTHSSCFSPLFEHPEMLEISRTFLVVHLDPPGMEEGAPPYPSGYQYPSLEQLAETVPCVLQQLHIPSIVGIGVGAGAFVLAKFGLLHPEAVEGLVLLNIDPSAKGWMDWAASKEELSAAPPPIREARERIRGTANVGLYWSMYCSRGDLGLERSGGGLKCPVLLVVGDGSPHEDAVVECNAKLDPTSTSFLKVLPHRSCPIDPAP